MRDGAGCLEQQQAAGRVGGVDTAPHVGAGDGRVVVVRLGGEDRQLEATLSVLSGVAGPGVAAGARQDRQHLVGEADLWPGGTPAHGDGHGSRHPADGDSDNRLSIGDGQELPGPADADDLGARRLVGCGVRQVSGTFVDGPLRVGGGHGKLGAGEVAFERDGRRGDLKLARSAGRCRQTQQDERGETGAEHGGPPGRSGGGASGARYRQVIEVYWTGPGAGKQFTGVLSPLALNDLKRTEENLGPSRPGQALLRDNRPCPRTDQEGGRMGQQRTHFGNLDKTAR